MPVNTRSMSRSLGEPTVVLAPSYKKVRKELVKQEQQDPQEYAQEEEKQEQQPQQLSEYLKRNQWPFYVGFVPAFMYCVYSKSTVSLIWVSVLSQVVHYLVRNHF